jgi:hypothetical protein
MSTIASTSYSSSSSSSLDFPSLSSPSSSFELMCSPAFALALPFLEEVGAAEHWALAPDFIALRGVDLVRGIRLSMSRSVCCFQIEPDNGKKNEPDCGKKILHHYC